MLHAIEFGADIPHRWELDHGPEQRVILRVRSRRITRDIAALIRHFGVAPEVVVTVVPLPFAIPVPRDNQARPVVLIAGAPGSGKSRLLTTMLRRYLQSGGAASTPDYPDTE